MSQGKKWISPVRLPKTIVPRHYDLKIQTNLDTFVFTGSETIKIEITEPTNTIVLNSTELNIKTVILKMSGQNFNTSNIILSEENETVTFLFSNQISSGEALLDIEFEGIINDKLKGLYRSKCVSTKDKEKYAAITQFAPADARRCFPCWDEPSIKATFSITLIVPAGKIALSNMPVLSETVNSIEDYVVTFDTTPIMSTYLVALIVGEFDYVEDISRDGILVRVYTPVGKKEQGAFALDVATKALSFYKDYFNIEYPLPKMDLIAVPEISYNAMENWGLVTYRENRLLVDSMNTSAITKQAVALVIGHELAHQWFGNLVTMDWWTHVWLNEGYASFIEFLCVNYLFPEMDIWSQFVATSYTRALELDRLDNSHPIEVPVNHPSEIDELLDAISYNKGASVIRMLYHYIGDEDFRKGMNIYLSRNQYSNTKTEDLWAALEEASKRPVGAVMSTWTKQMGFPVITVKFEEQDGSTIMTMTQDKYCADGTKASESVLWMVPITVSTQEYPNKEAFSVILEKHTQQLKLDHISSESWVKLNPGSTGYYRTSYPPEMMTRLISAVKANELPPLDRLGLLDDLYALVQAGHKSTVEFFQLMEAYTEERNYTVWVSISNLLSKLLLIFRHNGLDKSLPVFICQLYSKIYNLLGWEHSSSESHLDTLLRSIIIKDLVTCGDLIVSAEALKRFKSHVGGQQIIIADLRAACYRAALRDSQSENIELTLNNLLDIYKTAELQEEKSRIISAMASIQDPKMLTSVLEFSISDNVSFQDCMYFLESIASNPVGIELTWQFFKNNWELFQSKYKGSVLLARLVKKVTRNLSTMEALDDVQNFFKSRSTTGFEKTLEQGIEMIRLNVSWLSRDLNSVVSFISNYK